MFMLGQERGREAPMDLDSPPAVWCNSPVPPTSPEKASPRTASHSGDLTCRDRSCIWPAALVARLGRRQAQLADQECPH